MKACLLVIICFAMIFASSPAWAENDARGDQGRRFAIAPGAGGHVTNTKDGSTAGIAVSALFRAKDLPRFWPNIIGLNFAMNGDQKPDEPLAAGPAPENTLSLEAWWLPLKGGPYAIGFGGGGTWANFGVSSTDFGGLYGFAIAIETPDAAPDIMITIADHANLQKWDGFNLQARVQFVKDFDLNL